MLDSQNVDLGISNQLFKEIHINQFSAHLIAANIWAIAIAIISFICFPK